MLATSRNGFFLQRLYSHNSRVSPDHSKTASKKVFVCLVLSRVHTLFLFSQASSWLSLLKYIIPAFPLSSKAFLSKFAVHIAAGVPVHRLVDVLQSPNKVLTYLTCNLENQSMIRTFLRIPTRPRTRHNELWFWVGENKFKNDLVVCDSPMVRSSKRALFGCR